MPAKDSKTASEPQAPPEITGQSSLPSTFRTPIPYTSLANTACSVARIKKIIQLDEDIVQCSNNATFVVAMATVRDPASTPHSPINSLRNSSFNTLPSKDIMLSSQNGSRGRLSSTRT
jgi:hypothetical protein